MSRRHSWITHPTAKSGYSEDRQRAGIFALLHTGNIQSASAIRTPAYDIGSSNLPCGVLCGAYPFK